jgi:hypothetical protein
MGRTCCTHESTYKILVGKPEGNRPLGILVVDWGIKLKWILNRGLRLWAGLIWFVIWSSGEILLTL